MKKTKIITKEYLEKYIAPDLSKMTSEEIHKYLVKDSTEQDINTAEFVFWFSYHVENSITKNINGLVKNFINPKFKNNPELFLWLESISEQLHFGGKIKVMKSAAPKRYKKYLDFIDKVNILRNDLAHGRIKDMKWGSAFISNIEVKQKMIEDLYSTMKIALTDAVIPDDK